MDWLKKLIVGILGLFGLSTILSAKKSKEVEDFWTEILSDELLERPRS